MIDMVTEMKTGRVPIGPDEWNDYRSRLLAFVRGRVRSAEDAEDLVQEILLRAWRRRETIRDERKIVPWLYQIARNTLIDHYRRSRPETEGELPAGEVAATGDERSAERELASCLGPLLATLPDHYRAALELSELEGLTQRETAERLGISVSGAKSRVQRGRAMLAGEILDCCRLEFDSRGGIVGYEARRKRCRFGAGESCG